LHYDDYLVMNFLVAASASHALYGPRRVFSSAAIKKILLRLSAINIMVKLEDKHCVFFSEADMEKRKLGKTDIEVGVLGFGGSEIGYQEVPPPVVKRMLNSALDAGLNVIDTAECYAGSEELIGNALSERRKEYYLFTKCGHPKQWGIDDWRPSSLLKVLERSLRRLKTDCVDLLQLHSCAEAELRKGEVIEALKQARERGLTRYIGYSGDGQAARYAIECGEFDTLQTSVNIVEQEALDLTLPLARKHNVGVIAKRPVANVAWQYGKRRPESSYVAPYWERLQKLEYDFLKGRLPETVAIALRFTLTVPGVHTAIVGTTKPGRFEENAAGLTAGPLPNELFERIRAHWRETADRSWVGQT
jgi:aryl-alcohol dehydrogenase-like predicted oxidoreductase